MAFEKTGREGLGDNAPKPMPPSGPPPVKEPEPELPPLDEDDE
jgi:hypothetical protein